MTARTGTPVADLYTSRIAARQLEMPFRSSHTLLVLTRDPQVQAAVEPIFGDLNLISDPVGDDAIPHVRRFEPEVVLLDLEAEAGPGGERRFDLLAQILEIAPETRVIVIAENGGRGRVLRGVGLGASDFHFKPIDPDILSIIVRRAFRIRELEEENSRLREQTGPTALEGIIGVSDAMRSLCRAIEKIAPTSATALILGESGTGKELLARALHRLSGRARGPFVAINCAAIPENLLESELFGYEKGAFTGAVKRTPGKLESAEGGTVFLDEIGEMHPSLQAKLLRVVQERAVERVGGRTVVPLDLRLICATHRDLPSLIETGEFRQDLFYRLSEVTIRVPPLRDRQGDSLLLAQALMQQMAERYARPTRGLAPDAIRAIHAYRWPGNVRELENRIKGAVIMAEGSVITAADLGLHDPGVDLQYLNLRLARQRAEAQAVRQALAFARGNLSHASRLLGVTRPTLYDLVEKLQIDPSQFDAAADEEKELPIERPAALASS